MGRIKSLMIKRAARQLHATVEGFSSSFDHNKKLLKNVIPYKPMRNQVAGAITQLAKRANSQTKPAKAEASEIM